MKIKNISISLEEIKAFCTRWQVIEFALFGSVLRDDFRPDSDIDVMVRFDINAHPTFLNLEEMEAELKSIFKSIAISSDGNSLATASKDGTIQVRNLNGTLLINFDTKISQIKNIYFSRDNKNILGIKSNGTIFSWTMDIDLLIQRGCQWLEDYSRNSTNLSQKLCYFDG